MYRTITQQGSYFLPSCHIVSAQFCQCAALLQIWVVKHPPPYAVLTSWTCRVRSRPLCRLGLPRKGGHSHYQSSGGSSSWEERLDHKQAWEGQEKTNASLWAFVSWVWHISSLRCLKAARRCQGCKWPWHRI